MSEPLRIGTRGSALARAQTEWVAQRISEASGRQTEILIVKTEGDTSTESLASLGGTGVFATALRLALLRGDCDLVVHSLKDLPTASFSGLRIGAVPVREDPRDVLCASGGRKLVDLPPGARVGTGSPRRAAQLRSVRPDLVITDIRGNVDTRLAMVSRGDLDAVVLAAAGLSRLGRLDAVTEFFTVDDWPTAPGQGALAIEVREGENMPELSAVDDLPTRLSVTCERAVLAGLEAGCAAPVGANAQTTMETIRAHAVVYQVDGVAELGAYDEYTLSSSDDPSVAAERLGRGIAQQLLDDGAAELAPLGALP